MAVPTSRGNKEGRADERLDDIESVLPQADTVSESVSASIKNDAKANAKTAAVEAFRQGLSVGASDLKMVLSPSEPPDSKVARSTFKQPRRFPNPSLERAAAVGMLDLSDKLLFGGEDDALMNTYLGEDDLLAPNGDETVVLRYLSKQIAESTLTKVKSRLPLAVRPQLETEPSKVVLDAKNFQVIPKTVGAIDRSKNKTEDGAEQPGAQMLDAATMSQQIARLNQKVETLSRELLSLTAAVPQSVSADSDEAA